MNNDNMMMPPVQMPIHDNMHHMHHMHHMKPMLVICYPIMPLPYCPPMMPQPPIAPIHPMPPYCPPMPMPEPQPPMAPMPPTPPTQPAPPPGSIIHIVKAGDTVFKIAQAYGSTVDAIVKANNLVNPDLIYPGQRLIVPILKG